MHYYKRHIGDYSKKTGRLSMLEHGSYTLLIDACYDREKFPTLEEAIDWTWARTAEEVEAVKFVLSKFFTLEDGRYVQNRIREELEAYTAKSATNAQIAQEREEKKRQAKAQKQANSSERTDHEPARDVHASCTSRDDMSIQSNDSCSKLAKTPPNHKPLTINQEPLTNLSLCASEGIAEAAEILSDQKPAAPPSGWPVLKILNDKLRVAGYQPVTPRQLEITLVKFDLHFDESTWMSENRRLGKLVDWIGDKQRKRKDAWAAPESEKKPNPGNVDALWDRGEHQPPTDEQLAAFEQRKRQWAARDAALLAGVNHV